VFSSLLFDNLQKQNYYTLTINEHLQQILEIMDMLNELQKIASQIQRHRHTAAHRPNTAQ